MKSFFNLEGPFFTAITNIVDLVMLTFLFLVFSIPVVTIGASMTALYHSVHKVIRHDRGYVIKEFVNSFFDNIKQSTLIWLLMLLIYIVLGGECYLMYQYAIHGQKIGYVYIALMVVIALVVMWNIYIFPQVARFKNDSKSILKNAAILSMTNLVRSLIMIVVFIFFMLLIVSWPGLICILPGAFVAIVELNMEKIFVKYMSEEDKANEEELNREYKN